MLRYCLLMEGTGDKVMVMGLLRSSGLWLVSACQGLGLGFKVIVQDNGVRIGVRVQI